MSAYDTMDKAARSRAAPPRDAITPVNTPPETRMSIFPSDGILCERLTYDPLLDSKLDKKARHSRPPIYKQILDKVRLV
jgi:histone-lysine N-methyltransferase SETD1